MRRGFRALVAFTIASLVMTSVALADNIYNNVDATIDSAAESVTLNVGGSQVVTLAVQPTGTGSTPADGKAGCNLTGSTTLVTSVASSAAHVSVSPSSITWTSCGQTSPLTVTAVSTGSATISLAQTSNNTGGTFDLTPATFSVTVSSPPDPCASVAVPAAPVFGIDGDEYDGDNGWFVTIPTVSATSATAGATITYATDGATFSSTPPTLGQGTTTVTARATSATCNKTSESSTTFMVDTFGPTITDEGFDSGTPGTSPWYTSEVFNRFSATDATSGIPGTFTTPWTVGSGTAEGAAILIPSGTVTDVAGNTALSINSASYSIDLTNPSVAITQPTTNATTILSSVSVSGTATDTPSGIASVTVNGTAATVDTGAGTWSLTYSLACGANSLSAVATDNAGRTNTASGPTITRLCFTGLRFYQPLDQTVTGGSVVLNTGKWGRVIPTKVTLSSNEGPVTDQFLADRSLHLVIGVNSVACEGGAATDVVEAFADAGQANGGTNEFRWDATAQQWIYNLDTKSPPTMTMVVNSCYRLDVYISDGTNKVKVSTDTYAIFKPTK